MSARSYEGCAPYSEYADITRPKPSKKRKITGCFTAFFCLLFWCFMWDPELSFAAFIDYDPSLNFLSQLFSVWGVKLLGFIAFSLSGIVGAILIGYYTSQPISHSPHRQRAANATPEQPLFNDDDFFNHDDHEASIIRDDDLFGSTSDDLFGHDDLFSHSHGSDDLFSHSHGSDDLFSSSRDYMFNPVYSSFSCNIFNND